MIFQAEIVGIKLACEEMIKIPDCTPFKNVTIFSDSQAAVVALDSNEVTSRAVMNTKTALNNLANLTKKAMRLHKS